MYKFIDFTVSENNPGINAHAQAHKEKFSRNVKTRLF